MLHAALSAPQTLKPTSLPTDSSPFQPPPEFRKEVKLNGRNPSGSPSTLPSSTQRKHRPSMGVGAHRDENPRNIGRHLPDNFSQWCAVPKTSQDASSPTLSLGGYQEAATLELGFSFAQPSGFPGQPQKTTSAPGCPPWDDVIVILVLGD